MVKRRNWRPLASIVLEARERMIREAVGLNAFIDRDRVPVAWFAEQSADCNEAEEAPGKQPRSEPFLGIYGRSLKVFLDGMLVGQCGREPSLREDVAAWRDFTETHVAARTWIMLQEALGERLLAVPMGDDHEILVDPSVIRHPELDRMEKWLLPSHGPVSEGNPPASEDAVPDLLVGDHLNIVVGTLGTGRLDEGPVFGGGQGLVDGAEASRRALGVLHGRAVMIERKTAENFVDSFTEGEMVRHIPDEVLARRILDERRRDPDARKPDLLERSGVGMLTRADQDIVWAHAKKLATEEGVVLPQRGRRRSARRKTDRAS